MTKNNLLGKRIFSIILSIAVILSMMPAVVWADGGVVTQATVKAVEYINGIDGTGENINNPVYTTGTQDCEPLVSSNEAVQLNSGWYVAEGEITINSDVTLTGDTHIILANKAELTVNGSIIIPGGSKLYIYGQTGNAGEMTVTNKSGYAFKKGAGGGQASIYFYGGEVTATGVTSAIENGIYLYNSDAKQIMPMACYVDGEYEPIAHELWCGKDDLDIKAVKFSGCFCIDNGFDDLDPNVWDFTKVTAKSHKRVCKFCDYKYGGGMDSAVEEACNFEKTIYYKADANGHTAICACGNESDETEAHDQKGQIVLTEGNKKHATGCSVCGYASGEPQNHDYNEYGSCEDCQFLPIMSDSNGNLYDDYDEAFAAVVAGKAEYVQLESKATDSVVSTALEFDYPGQSVTLKMNGKTLLASGNATLEVSGGSLIIEGDANISFQKNTQIGPAIKVTGGTLTFNDGLTANGGGSTSNTASAIEVTGGNVTFEGDVIAIAQSITTTQVGYTLAPAIKVMGGNVTFRKMLTATGGIYNDNWNLKNQEPAVYADAGTLDFQGNLDLNGGLTLTGSAALSNKLTQGTFTVVSGANKSRISVEGSTPYKYITDLLDNGYGFADKENSTQFKGGGNYTTWSICDLTIAAHTHEWKQDDTYKYLHSCVCGASENHKYDSSNGKCTICPSECPHDSFNNDGTCMTCHAQMTVKIEVGDKTTYSTDFKTAMDTATDGTKITLLADIANYSKHACITGEDIKVTLNLDGHTINGGWIKVGRDQNGDINTSSTLKITGTGSFISDGNLSVIAKATLDLSDWTGGEITEVDLSKSDDDESTLIVGENAGTIGTLQVLNWPTGNEYMNCVKNTELSGGSYGSITITMKTSGNDKAIPYSSMLAQGYAFQYIESGEFVPYETKAEYANGGGSLYNVKVVKCPHSEIDLGADGETKTCKHCGLTGKFVATVDGNAYTSWDQVFNAWLQDGGTLKLYDDYTASNDVVWNGSNGEYILDLNGHTMSAGSGAFKPSDEKVAGMSLTIRDTSEDQNGSISHIILSSENNYRNLTLDSGHIGNLEVVNYVAAGVVLKGGSIGNLQIKEYGPNGFMLEGGSIGAYSLPKGVMLADLLYCFGYYCTDSDVDLTKNARTETSEIRIKEVPLQALGSGNLNGETFFGGEIPFTLMSTWDDSEAASYTEMWYRRANNGAQLMETVTRDQYGAIVERAQASDAFSGLQAGNKVDVFCVLRALDSNNNLCWQTASTGYKLTVKQANLASEKTAITQKPGTGNTQNPADNRLVVVPKGTTELANAFEDVTYQFDVTYNGITLTPGTDYTIKDNSNKANEAGEHKLTIVGTGNYTGEKTVTWTLEPYELSSEHVPTQITKEYDGTTNGEDITDGKGGLGTFAIDSTNTKNPTVATNFLSAIKLYDGDFALSNMHFDSAEAGDRTFYFTLTLDNENFIFANKQKSAQFELKRTTSNNPAVSITPATIADPAAKDLQIVNNHAATYTVDLAKMLPELTAPCEYGDVTYQSKPQIQMKDGYYTLGEASVSKEGILTLPINDVDSSDEGKIGTVTLTATTTNYNDITLTVNVNAVNKDVPTLDGAVALTPAKLTYGDKLSKITVSGTMKDSQGVVVEGSFAWKLPEYGPAAGTYEAEWIFTPDDMAKYISVTGKVNINVEKADVTGSPKYTAISEDGKTLTDAGLTVTGGTFSVAGTVKWEAADTTEVKQGEKYKWIFTPNDTANYNTLTGEITLWPYPAAGGGVAPADEDVITVEDKTSSETTTKTTVKDTKTETVKNEQGEEISKVTATVSEKVAEKLVDQAVSNKSDTVEITVKSNDGNKVDGEKQTEIEIPKKAVESIAKDTEADLVIKTDNGQVILDNKTLETIAAEAEGDTVRIVVNENTQLKETQKPASDVIGKNGKLFDIKAVIGGKYIHDFKGGKAHVTLPMPEKLKGKDIVIIYINDKGICEILNHTMETVGAEEYIKFTTSHFSNFAVVEKADAEKIIEQQNTDKINSLIKEAKLKATTSKTTKKNVKIKVSVKNNSSLIKEAKAMGYTVKYKFYRSTKKASKYKAVKTKTSNSFINTKGKKGTKYYYKAKVMVYDGKKLVTQTTLKQCRYGARRWSK